METSSETSPTASASSLTRRQAAARVPSSPAATGARGQRPAIHGDIDPPPRPRPVMQWLAIAGIVGLACLQFLPVTHIRDPSDPRRSWIPVDPNRANSEEQAAEDRGVDVFSWSDCLDLRVLAVLANSTLSGSSNAEGLSLHFLIPEDADEKLSYYKLKVVLPNSNLVVTGQREVKEKLNVATPEGNFLWSFRSEIAPFLVAITHLSSKKFVYVSPNTIVKGKIEDLSGIDLGPHAIGAVEDCSKRLNEYVNIEILNAIQRTAAKSWVSKEPYDKDACLPDFNVLLVKPRKLERTLVEAIMWWTKVVRVENPRDQIRLAAALTFYGKYLKLPSAWKLGMNDDMNILDYDGPKLVCSEDGRRRQESAHGNIWQQYLPQKSIGILTD